jgi:hypothetical protein
VIEKLRACVPPGTGKAPKAIMGVFPRGHESIVRAMLEAMATDTPGIEWQIDDDYVQPKMNRVLCCRWVGNAG